MKGSVPFLSPKSMEVTLDLPHHGPITGMGLKQGITLIVGGGYHGKSTLLKALEAGVYDHIAGDGREYVITDQTAMKLRAEDGRSIQNVDISLFINDLPNGRDTHSFSTEDASGSTSQAAAVVEGIEAGSRVFLIDEDTSATNFMVRDDLMQKIISRDQEPITPFIERARDLYEKAGISTIMVAGSSGAYFYIADTILQMDCYKPHDITEKTKAFCAGYGAEPITSAPGFILPPKGRKLSEKKAVSSAPLSKGSFSQETQGQKPFGRGGHAGPRGRDSRSGREDRIKVKVFGKDSIQIDRSPVDLRFVEQLIDPEQTNTLSQILRYCVEHQLLDRFPLTQAAEILLKEIEKGGIAAIGDSSYAACGMAMPRVQEIFACLNRYRNV